MSPAPRRPARRTITSAIPLWLAVVFVALTQRVSAVRSSGERGDGPTVSNVLWAVAAMTAALLAGGVIYAYITGQLAIFGG
ncbi:MAG: hypothetical protein M3400_08920 [Actinomycetota bacterium]|nr:hypothetical protein [Actinomycetota bacterium]